MHLINSIQKKIFSTILVFAFFTSCQKDNLIEENNSGNGNSVVLEKYFGTLIEKSGDWNGNYPPDTTITEITIKHLHANLDIYKDTIIFCYPNSSSVDSARFVFSNVSSDSVKYELYSCVGWDPYAGELIQYYNPPEVPVNFHYYLGVMTQVSIEFTGEKQ